MNIYRKSIYTVCSIGIIGILFSNLANAQIATEDIESGNLTKIKALVQESKDIVNQRIDVGNGYFATPLILASIAKQIDIMKFLIENGADVNARVTINNISSLHFASDAGSVDGVLLLLNSGAQVNARDLNGNTPIFWANKSARQTEGSIVPFQKIIGILKKHGGT